MTKTSLLVFILLCVKTLNSQTEADSLCKEISWLNMDFDLEFLNETIERTAKKRLGDEEFSTSHLLNLRLDTSYKFSDTSLTHFLNALRPQYFNFKPGKFCKKRSLLISDSFIYKNDSVVGLVEGGSDYYRVVQSGLNFNEIMIEPSLAKSCWIFVVEFGVMDNLVYWILSEEGLTIYDGRRSEFLVKKTFAEFISEFKTGPK